MMLIVLTIGLLALAFGGIAIKIWSQKDGKFAGTCASQSPFLNTDGEACGMCGKLPSEQDCRKDTDQEVRSQV
ncbi:MAG: membrane or secreted protein [Pricia sp.]|nr:membrane or secreted protein [Pricia sp.]